MTRVENGAGCPAGLIDDIEQTRGSDKQHEVAMLVRSIRSAADDLRALKLWFAQDDIHALDAAGVDIEQLIRPQDPN